MVEERNQLITRLQKAQVSSIDSSGQQDGGLVLTKKKKVRRCANEIERSQQCKVPGCTRQYGTEGSLLQHMRLKHEDYVKNNQIKLKGTSLSPRELIKQQMHKQDLENINRKHEEFQLEQ